LGSDLPAGEGKIDNLFLQCTFFGKKIKPKGILIAEALIIILETFLQSEEIENLVVTESAAGVRYSAVRHVLREERRSSLENVGGRRSSLLLCRNGRRGSTLGAEASAAASGNGNGKSSPRCSVDGTAAMAAGGIKRRKSLYETAGNGAEGERRWEGGDIGVMEVETSTREDEPTPGQDTTQGEETKKIEDGPVLIATAAKLGIGQERDTRDKPSQ
jgi:hypothetical protein